MQVTRSDQWRLTFFHRIFRWCLFLVLLIHFNIIMSSHVLSLHWHYIARYWRGLNFAIHAHYTGFRIGDFIILRLKIPHVPLLGQNLFVKLWKLQNLGIHVGWLVSFVTLVSFWVWITILSECLWKVCKSMSFIFVLETAIAVLTFVRVVNAV